MSIWTVLWYGLAAIGVYAFVAEIGRQIQRADKRQDAMLESVRRIEKAVSNRLDE